MSENWLQLIPTDPAWIPGPEHEQAAVALLNELAPASDEIQALTYDEVVFVDAGANFESVSCPACNAELEMGWWSAAMGGEPAVVTPCCGALTTLNDLRYHWPQGFAQWVLRARSPGRMDLTAEELQALEAVVGHPLREIWSHY